MDSDTVLENLREPVFAVGLDRRVTFASGRFLAVTGLREDEVLGAELDLIEPFVAEGFADVGDAVAAVADGRADEKRVEATMEHPADAPVPRRLPAEFRVTPVVEDDDRTGALVVLRDASERAARERELRRSERRFEAVLETPESFVAVLDPDGTVRTINRTALDLVGATEADVVGEPFPETPWWNHSGALQDRLRAWIDRAADGEFVRFDAVHRSGDGERVPVDGVVRPVRGDDDEVVSVIVEGRDVSERDAYAEELKRKNERLERFANVVSHDLRNPLNVAQARLALAREERESEDLAAADRALDRIERLVADLLALTREGRRAVEREPVDIDSFARDCWETVVTDGADLRVETDRTVLADEGRLRQAFENLFRNAVEHGDDQATTVTVGDCEEGFYVADDGPGIPAGDRERVFEAGYSTASDGTGFGLNIVATVADVHGWDVTATESESGGARFEFRGVEFA